MASRQRYGSTLAWLLLVPGLVAGQQVDVSADGAEVHFSNDVVNLYLNQGGVLETSPSWSFDSSAVGTALAFGDVNGDGMPDLIVGNSGDVSVMVFYNQLPLPVLFADGFESGDTQAWSSTVP